MNQTTSHAHPAHPAFVHFPLAFLFAAQTCDIIYGVFTHPATTKLAANVYDASPFLTDIGRLGHLFNIIGLVTAIPAVLTGGVELFKLLQRQDMPAKLKNASAGATKESAEQTLSVAKRAHPKVKVAFLHAAAADLVVAGAAYNWYTKRGAAAVAPNDVNVMVSAATALLLALTGVLGGKMVFDHGVGVDARRGLGRGTKEE
jgi:uncharacterized membrane protein